MPSLADLPLPTEEVTPVVAEAPSEAVAAPVDALPTPFDAIAAGQLPGLQVPPFTKEAGALDPIQDFVVSNLHVLQANGIEYTDLPNDTTVLYNPEVVTTEAIAAAFKAGTLDELVPSSAAYQEFIQKQAAGPSSGLAGVPTPSAPPAGSTPPGVNRMRLQNVEPPTPIKPNPIPDQLARRAI